jgi:hypothetical protein
VSSKRPSCIYLTESRTLIFLSSYYKKEFTFISARFFAIRVASSDCVTDWMEINSEPASDDNKPQDEYNFPAPPNAARRQQSESKAASHDERVRHTSPNSGIAQQRNYPEIYINYYTLRQPRRKLTMENNKILGALLYNTNDLC